MTPEDRDEEIAKAMETARQVSMVMAEYFTTWVDTQPPESVTLAGAGSGMAKLSGMILSKTENRDARNAGAIGAVVTLLANCECDAQLVLENAARALKRYALATAEVAGSA